MYAAASEPCTRALIAAGANVNHRDERGQTVLYLAAKLGNVAYVTTLAAAGAHHIHSPWGPPLTAACHLLGNLDCVAALIKAGACVNAQESRGQTALMRARTGECAQALIDAGACIDIRCASGGTPLHMAAHLDRPDVVRVLLWAGRDPDLVDDTGCTPLMEVAVHGKPNCYWAPTPHTHPRVPPSTHNAPT